MIRPRRSAICAVTLVLTLASSCASSGAGNNMGSDAPDVAPRMVSRLSPPMLRVSSVPASGRSPLRVSLEVLIDADGRPDMSTFRVTGQGAAENRDALATWIQQSTFTPAARGGVVVPGVYRARFAARARR